jgi:hypothetical protein
MGGVFRGHPHVRRPGLLGVEEYLTRMLPNPLVADRQVG